MPYKSNAFLNVIILKNNLIQDFSIEKSAVLKLEMQIAEQSKAEEIFDKK